MGMEVRRGFPTQSTEVALRCSAFSMALLPGLMEKCQSKNKG